MMGIKTQLSIRISPAASAQNAAVTKRFLMQQYAHNRMKNVCGTSVIADAE